MGFGIDRGTKMQVEYYIEGSQKLGEIWTTFSFIMVIDLSCLTTRAMWPVFLSFNTCHVISLFYFEFFHFFNKKLIGT